MWVSAPKTNGQLEGLSVSSEIIFGSVESGRKPHIMCMSVEGQITRTCWQGWAKQEKMERGKKRPVTELQFDFEILEDERVSTVSKSTARALQLH